MSGTAEPTFPEPTEAVIQTLISFFRTQNNAKVCEVLQNAESEIQLTDFDNWDGGQDIFMLFLKVPLEMFARIEPKVSALEKAIEVKLPNVFRNMGRSQLRSVNISPILERPARTGVRPVKTEDADRLWTPQTFRLFLSHVSSHKIEASRLKGELNVFGVSCFVAHDDIEPTLEWSREIELALRSMHALAALLTPDFHNSNWTDQEVGFALGRGVLIIPVRLGLDPYGLFGKIQGTQGTFPDPEVIASSIVDLLLKNRATEEMIREALILALRRAPSYADSKAITSKLERVSYFTSEQIESIRAASKSNSQVRESYGVPDRLMAIVERTKTTNTPEDTGK